jgi:hypothetical protein
MNEPRREEQQDDTVDGCDLDFTEDTTSDNDIESLLEVNEDREEEDAIRHGDGSEAP